MKESHRTASICAGIYALIQGIAWALLAIYSCAIYGCVVDFPFLIEERITTSRLLYLSYFKGSCRAPPGSPLVEAPSAVRTYFWMLIYGVVSSLWIPTSVLLIVAAVNKIKGKMGICLYYPWIINAAIIQIIDLVAFIIYTIDIKQTMTVSDYEKFINQIEKVPGANGITVVPAIVMALWFSRGIIFWIINLILLGIVIQAAHSVSKVSPTSQFIESGTRVSQIDTVGARWFNPSESNVILSGLPRVNQRKPTPSPIFLRNAEHPDSPQSPISEIPPPPMMREPSLRRTQSANNVYDVYGRPTTEALPQNSPIYRRGHHENTGNGALNNQLPWSYINPQELSTKKHELKTIKGVPKPPIPVPDYSIRYEPKLRVNLSRSSSSVVPSSSYSHKMWEGDSSETKRAPRRLY